MQNRKDDVHCTLHCVCVTLSTRTRTSYGRCNGQIPLVTISSPYHHHIITIITIIITISSSYHHHITIITIPSPYYHHIIII